MEVNYKMYELHLLQDLHVHTNFKKTTLLLFTKLISVILQGVLYIHYLLVGNILSKFQLPSVGAVQIFWKHFFWCKRLLADETKVKKVCCNSPHK